MSIDIPSFIMPNRINSDIELNISRLSLTTCSSSTENLVNKPTDSIIDMSCFMASPAAAASSLDIDMYSDTRPSLNVTDCVSVPSSEHVAEIVGRQGCKIKALRNRTNTYIKTPTRGENPVFIITGRRNDVAQAKSDILLAAEHFTNIRASRGPNKLVSTTTSINENNNNKSAGSFTNSNTTNICNSNKIHHVSQRYCFDNDSVFSYDCEDNCSSNMSIAEESTTSKQQDRKYCFATPNNLTKDLLRMQSPSVSYFSSSSADSNHSFSEDVRRRSASRSPLFDQNSNTDSGHDKFNFQTSSTTLNISYSMEFSSSTTTDSSFVSEILLNDTIRTRTSSNKSGNNDDIAVRATCGENEYNNIENDVATPTSSPVVVETVAYNTADHKFPNNKSYQEYFDGSTNQCLFCYPDNLDVICCKRTDPMHHVNPDSNSFNCINKRTATNNNHSKETSGDRSAKSIDTKNLSSISDDHKCLLLRRNVLDRSQTCYANNMIADTTTTAYHHPNDEGPLRAESATNDTISVGSVDGNVCRNSQVTGCNKNHVIVQLRVPYRIVGLVVGPKGATIKRIQQTTHTYIVTPSKNKDPVFEITGRHDQVVEACRQIEAHVISRTGYVDLIGNMATTATFYGSPPLDLITATTVNKPASPASPYPNYNYNIPNSCYNFLPSTNTNIDGAAPNNLYECKEDLYNSVNFSKQQPQQSYRRQCHPHNYSQLASNQFSTAFVSSPNLQQQQLLDYYRHHLYSRSNEHTKIDTFTNKVLDNVFTYRPQHPINDPSTSNHDEQQILYNYNQASMITNNNDGNEITSHKLIMIDTNDTAAFSSTSTSCGDSTAAVSSSSTHSFYSSPTRHSPHVQDINGFYPYRRGSEQVTTTTTTTTHGFADNDEIVVNNNIGITAQYSSNLSNNHACTYDEAATNLTTLADSAYDANTISTIAIDDVSVVSSFNDNEFSQDYNSLGYVTYNELLRNNCTIQQHHGNYMDAVNVILSNYNGKDVPDLYNTSFSTKIMDKEPVSSFQVKQNFYHDDGGGDSIGGSISVSDTAAAVKSNYEDNKYGQIKISQNDHSTSNEKLDEKENEEQRFMSSFLQQQQHFNGKNSKTRISSMTIASYYDEQSQGHHKTPSSSTGKSDHFVLSTRHCDYSKIFDYSEYCSMHDSIGGFNNSVSNSESLETYDVKNKIKIRDYSLDGAEITSYSINSGIDDPSTISNTAKNTPITHKQIQQSIPCSNRFRSSKLAKRFNHRKANILTRQSNALTTNFADGRNVPLPATSAASTIQQQTIEHRDNVIFQPNGFGVDFLDGHNLRQQRVSSDTQCSNLLELSVSSMNDASSSLLMSSSSSSDVYVSQINHSSLIDDRTYNSNGGDDDNAEFNSNLLLSH